MVAADIDNKALEAAALADDKVQEALGGKSPKKIIIVPKKMVNIVV
jgi:leucyl-tRNA synthetase